MSDSIVMEIIKTLAMVATAVISGIVSLRLGKMHKQFNSRMDELLAATRREGKAEGKAEEKANQGVKNI